MKEYDLIVIGSGPGGYIAAAEAGKAGIKTAIVEKGAYGGVCLNIGCIPTKTLLKSSQVYDYINHADKYGIEVRDLVHNITPQWSAMQKRKQKVVAKLNKAVEFLMRSNNVDMIKGTAAAKDANTIVVEGEEIKFKYLILATGSKPRHLPLPGFEEAQNNGFLINSTGALGLEMIPRKLAVIGGGVIGMEFACLFNELGSEVTILQGLPTILEMLDSDVARTMTKIFTQKGIKIFPNSKIIKIANKAIYFENKEGALEHIEADFCLESVGRQPYIEGFDSLNLQKGKIGNIETNEYMQTNIAHIYAIGDVNGRSMLAHTASKEALIAVGHIQGGSSKMRYDQIPNAMYTHPEVACVGMTEAQIKEHDVPYTKSLLPLSSIGKALADGATEGFIKILAGKKYNNILGVHMVAPTATDMIGEITAALASEATVAEIANAVHPHPTYSEAIYEAARKMKEQ